MRERLEWRPSERQQTFLASRAYEALYGGAAGGGKSDALLMGALRYVSEPSYRALLLRRTFPELQRSLIERALQWYPLLGGHKSDGGKLWRWPSGAVVEFGHLEHEQDVHNYQSAEYQYIAFDELTLFLERQYVYMLSRARSAGGIPIRIRAGTNPGGVGHDWVKRRWGPWLDEHHARPAASGEVRHYRNEEEGERWCERGAETLSRVFVKSLATDNPHLMANDPGYATRLGSLDPVTRRRLRDGDWTLFQDEGALWRREWFKDGRRSEPPQLRRIVVAVDPAGSAKKTADETGIVVAGIGSCMCLGRPELHLFVLKDLSGRYAPKDMARITCDAYHSFKADMVIGEDNFGGKIIEDIIELTDRTVAYTAVHASRGKMVRAEPVAAVYHQGRAHHVGTHMELEDQLCTWNPMTSSVSPGRLDALVWAGTALMLGGAPASFGDEAFASPQWTYGNEANDAWEDA